MAGKHEPAVKNDKSETGFRRGGNKIGAAEREGTGNWDYKIANI